MKNNALAGDIVSLKILEKSIHILFIVLIYSSAFYFFSFITADPDLWGHIKFGEHLWASKNIPTFDIYSYTNYGYEWINHEWFSELLMYLIYDSFGSPGLLISKILIGFTIISILSLICQHRNSALLVYGIVLVVSTFVMSPGFMTRPQIMTFLFVSLFLFVFHLYIERNKNVLWLLPLIMLFWVNSHGGFLVGVGMLPLVVACEIIYCRAKRKDYGYLRSLFLWCILTEISVLVNPYGPRLLIFLYESLCITRNISEWNPITIFDLSYVRFKVFSILVILSIFLYKKNNRYWEIVIIIVTMLYAFMHQRHTPIFAIVAAPYLTEKLTRLWKQAGLSILIKSFPSLIILNIVLILLIGHQVSYTANKYIKAGFNIIVDPRLYPLYAVHFLKENGIKGNILLPFEWGEYVIWKLYPDCKVSIDGRFRTAYPEKVLNDHFKALANEEMWLNLLDSYNSNIVLARRDSFAKWMKAVRKDWIYVYSDNISMIFIKDVEFHKETLKRFRSKDINYPRNKLSVLFP